MQRDALKSAATAPFAFRSRERRQLAEQVDYGGGEDAILMWMPALRYPRLASLWCHWILANATAVGTITGVARVFFWHEDYGYHFRWADLFPTILAVCVAFALVGNVQQLILRRWLAYIDYWALMMPAMFLMGLFLGWPIGLLITSALQSEFGPLSVEAERITVVLSLGMPFGIGLGFLQALYVTKTPRKSLLWMVVSGLAVALGLWGLFAVWWMRTDDYRLLNSTFGQGALAGTAGGAVYGFITGTGLVFLLRGHKSFPVKMRY